MPVVDFAHSGELEQVAGLGAKAVHLLESGKYPGIPYKVARIHDIKHSDYDKLPREAQLTLTHIAGRQYTRAEVARIAKKVIKLLKLTHCEIVGSYRREKELLNDIDILAVCSPPSDTQLENPKIKVIRAGDSQIKLLFKIGNSPVRFDASQQNGEWAPVDILFTTREHYPFALAHFTGSMEHNMHMRAHAKKMGYLLNQYGLYKNGRALSGIKSEKDIYKKLGLTYKPPQDR
jgi:DNA polymerase (family 10)